MELLQIIKGRKSIRGFKDTDIKKKDIDDILKNAIWAPNWGNIQPWEIAVFGRNVVRRLSERFVDNFKSGVIPNPDIEMPETYPSKNKKRYIILARDLFKEMGIGRQDKEARMSYYIDMYSFFRAPAAIYLCMEKGISPNYGPLNLGILCENICLLAHEKGLGTCVMACLCHYPDVIRDVTGMGNNLQIVLGIAIGYPDYDAPANSFQSSRDENVVTWYGFE